MLGRTFLIVIKPVSVVALCFFTLAAPAVAQQYLCVSDKSSGFAYDESSRTWDHAGLETDGQSFLVASDGSESGFQVTQVGDSFVVSRCSEGFDEYGYLTCEGIWEFKFNRRNGRFVTAFVFGYLNVLPGVNDITDATSNTPSITIGTCSLF